MILSFIIASSNDNLEIFYDDGFNDWIGFLAFYGLTMIFYQLAPLILKSAKLLYTHATESPYSPSNNEQDE